MPTVRVRDIDIYYEILPASESASAQERTPLLLIMGLALSSLSWKRLLPYLTHRRSVIIFDNRGTGRSSKPDQSYSIRQMAEDAAGLLEVIGVRRADVFGYSMGSMIAQEVALNYPDRVRRLVLGASTPGGLRHRLAPARTLYTMTVRTLLEGQAAYEAVVPILYSPQFIRQHPEIIKDDAATRLIYPTPAYAYRRQLRAIAFHNTYSRLNRLPMPTLVLTGDRDQMIPSQNSRVLAGRIPRARLVIFPGGGHNLPSEQPARLAQVVLDFLDQNFKPPQSEK